MYPEQQSNTDAHTRNHGNVNIRDASIHFPQDFGSNLDFWDMGLICFASYKTTTKLKIQGGINIFSEFAN